MTSEKPVHTIVLDAGPIIKGDASISSLLAQATQLITLPSVVNELRDEVTRTRVHTTLLPFLTLRTPKESSVQVISEFSRKTGDLSVLSKVDIGLLALAYEVECERNGGDWRLRRAPGEKRINGPKPGAKSEETTDAAQDAVSPESKEANDVGKDSNGGEQTQVPQFLGEALVPEPTPAKAKSAQSAQDVIVSKSDGGDHPEEQAQEPENSQEVASTSLTNLEDEARSFEQASTVEETELQAEIATTAVENLHLSDTSNANGSEDSDSEGWITPSNLKKKQEKDSFNTTDLATEPKSIQVALLSSDYAMQNVALQMNLNLLSPSLQRIRHIKTFVLRCHACFLVIRDTSKQFCPRCGKPALTRVSCSTTAAGTYTLHLKKKMQWNTRGDRFSIPKPVAGAANGKVKGGGKNGWGNELILAEDQKEYVRAVEKQKRERHRDFMDEDYLPGILTGERAAGLRGGKIAVGAGRNVNSRKRK